MRAYRRTTGGWQAFWETELDFGHCVLAGTFDGRPGVIVSNRAGSKSLLLFQFGAGGSMPPRKIVVEEGVGAANMLVLPRAGGDLLFAANQAAREIAVYSAGQEAGS